MQRVEVWRPHRVFILLSALAVGLVAWVIFQRQPKAPAGSVPIPVSAAQAVNRDVTVSIDALGAAQAWTTVTVIAQVNGKLLAVDFTEGTDVHRGQLLAQIDPTPYLAVLTQAKGVLGRDQASLANARLDLVRYQNLLAQNAISRQVLDTQAAVVKQDEGSVQADQGAVAAAQVNVNYCRITSPVDGRVGVRLVDPGNLVSAGGSTGIVVVSQIEPIAVTFTVPEGEFQNLLDLSAGFTRPLMVKAKSQETGALLDSGELSIADNRVDPATGTVELKARFPNAGRHLWPGQFVNVQLTLQTLRQVTTIPEDAVNRGPNGAFVFLIGSNNVVAVRPVETGWTQGNTVVIAKGVKAGDLVVTDGQMILKAGSKVRVVKPAPGRSGK